MVELANAVLLASRAIPWTAIPACEAEDVCAWIETVVIAKSRARQKSLVFISDSFISSIVTGSGRLLDRLLYLVFKGQMRPIKVMQII